MYDKDLAEFVKSFFTNNYQGFLELRLYGSRTTGTYRESSDHDFYAIFSDNAAEGMDIGRLESMQALEELRRAVRQREFLNPKVDVHISKLSTFQRLSADNETHAYQAFHNGVIV
ncbi:MAG: hypothetical protein COA41_11420 [Sphingopyxis sp.]|nr:MAG: hypothetical protein COA41_11420 [Sphingopyxis sp.]